jgi:hypothetical protein
MPKLHRTAFAALPLVLALQVGCDSSTGPDDSGVGSLSFTYTGAINGSFQASGEMDLDSPDLPEFTTGATAAVQEDLLSLFAFRTRTAPRGDFFVLLLGQVTTTGTFDLNPLGCAQQNISQCRIGVFVPNLNPSEFDDVLDLDMIEEQAYVLAIGSVTVTSISNTRIRGTFQGIAFRGTDPSIGNMLNINNGTFDMPIRRE